MSDNHQPGAAKTEDQFPDHFVADYVFGDLDHEDRRRVEQRMVRDVPFLQEVMEMQGTVELLRVMGRTATHRVVTDSNNASPARRRLRLKRLAIAATLFVAVGVSAAAYVGHFIPLVGRNPASDGRPGSTNPVVQGQSSQADPARTTSKDTAQVKVGQPTKGAEAPPSLIAQQSGATSPLANLVTRGHPVAGPSFWLKDGDHEVPLLPMDPLRPFAHFDWFGPFPAHVTDCKFDPARRVLRFKLRFTASPAAVNEARREIARAYNANGHPSVKPEDINIQPLQRVGYRLALDTSQGDLVLKTRQDGPITTTKISVTAEIPSNYKALIDNLTTEPDYVSLVAAGLYDFEYSTSASTEAQGLRLASLKALEEINGGKPPTGPLVVDRRGKQEYLQRMRNEVVVWAKGYGMDAGPMVELALQHLGKLEPMSFREFLDQPGQLMVWNTEMGRLELQPEKYDLLTQETRKLLEEQDQVKSLSKSISDLATHESDEWKFYNRLKETFDLHAKAKGGIPAVFSADLEMDLKKTYDQLSSGEKKAVSDYKRSASNESEFESKHLRRGDELFRGKNHVVGTAPKGWDLYRLTDETIVGETLFGSHQVKLIDVKTVAISEEFPIEVEKIDIVETQPPAFREMGEKLREMEGKFRSQKDQVAELRARQASNKEKANLLAARRHALEEKIQAIEAECAAFGTEQVRLARSIEGAPSRIADACFNFELYCLVANRHGAGMAVGIYRRIAGRWGWRPPDGSEVIGREKDVAIAEEKEKHGFARRDEKVKAEKQAFEAALKAIIANAAKIEEARKLIASKRSEIADIDAKLLDLFK